MEQSIKFGAIQIVLIGYLERGLRGGVTDFTLEALVALSLLPSAPLFWWCRGYVAAPPEARV